MREAVIVDAVRTPIARGKMIKGDLSGIHAAHLLNKVQSILCERNGLAPSDIEQVIGGMGAAAKRRSRRNGWETDPAADHPQSGFSVESRAPASGSGVRPPRPRACALSSYGTTPPTT